MKDQPATAPLPYQTEALEFRSRSRAERDVEVLAMRIDDVARAIGLCRRTIEREIAAGRFPKPDKVLGQTRKTRLWRPETIRRWIEGGGNP